MTGQIRLLGQGTASLALAATLRDSELQKIYQRRQLDYEAAGISFERLMDMVRQTRQRGHSVSLNLLTSGASGVGIAIALQAQHVAAVSVANYNASMTAEHQTAALQVLKEEVALAGLTVLGW